MVLSQIILTMTAFLFFAFQSPRAGGDSDLKLLLDKTLPTQTGQKLDVDLYSGSVKITNNASNDVTVKIYGNDNAEENVTFDVTSNESGVIVKSDKKEGVKNLKNVNIRVEIGVPANYNVKVKTGGGSVSLTALTGSVEVNTSGGSVSLGSITGDIDVSTAGGSISVEQNTGMLKLETAGGSIKAKKFEGSVDVSTAGGSIQLTGSNGKVEGNTAAGSIHVDYTGKNYGIDLNTMAGTISVDLPADFDANADLTTMTGKIHNDFDNTNGAKGKVTMKGKINNGGETLKCSTMAGSINLNKK